MIAVLFKDASEPFQFDAEGVNLIDGALVLYRDRECRVGLHGFAPGTWESFSIVEEVPDGAIRVES